MKSDSYPRFIRSSAYQELLQAKKKATDTTVMLVALLKNCERHILRILSGVKALVSSELVHCTNHDTVLPSLSVLPHRAE